LINLNLSWNNLNGSLPETFGNLVSLKNLYLLSNQLSGEITDSFNELVNLNNVRLEIIHNYIIIICAHLI